MNFKRDVSVQTYSGFVLSALFVLSLLQILLQNMPDQMTRAGDELLQLSASEGVANAVTTVVVYFRGFDTLGEVSVLFIAALGIGLMMSTHGLLSNKIESSYMLKVAAKLLFPIIMIFGIYVMVYGHLSPGGGFQGGVIIASGVLLLLISYADFELSHKFISLLEMLAGVSYVLIGLIGLWVADSFLSNFLPHDISRMGMLISGGIIPIIYIVVGVKVGSEMSLIVHDLLKRSDDA